MEAATNCFRAATTPLISRPVRTVLAPIRYCFALAMLGLIGCQSTPILSRNDSARLASPAVTASARTTAVAADQQVIVRMQSPTPASELAVPVEATLPPSPDASQTTTSSAAYGFSPSIDSPVPQPLNTLEVSSQTRSAVIPPAAVFNDPMTSPSTRQSNGNLSNLNPILRNRIEDATGGDEDASFNYPDIHADPGQLYHDRFGVDAEHDPFLFPPLVNLIYEDRWLLAEKDPTKALQNMLKRRMKVDIRDPDPDTANFPNGAYTLPKGRLYIENSPVGFYSASRNGGQPRVYQWEYLIRYGLTDNLEFRVFSNGITDQGAHGLHPEIVGYSPLAFDFKANFWEENTRYHIPAMGVEIYLQTSVFGSSAFNAGTQPSINLLFDQSLPLGIGFEYNFGITGAQDNLGQIAYQFSYQWSFQREVVKDFDVFIHGFYNAAALPRISQFQSAAHAEIPNVTVVGLGGIWTVNNRLSLFGSYNFGVTPAAPTTIALMGFAVAM